MLTSVVATDVVDGERVKSGSFCWPCVQTHDVQTVQPVVYKTGDERVAEA